MRGYFVVNGEKFWFTFGKTKRHPITEFAPLGIQITKQNRPEITHDLRLDAPLPYKLPEEIELFMEGGPRIASIHSQRCNLVECSMKKLA